MKTILVVDIPDELEYEELYFDGEIRCTSEFDKGYVFLKETGRCLLKPLPKKKNTEMSLNAINDWLEHSERLGYNACIDEILGEEND